MIPAVEVSNGGVRNLEGMFVANNAQLWLKVQLSSPFAIFLPIISLV